MSINPQYVQAIEAGDKLIEFRKKNFSKKTKYVLIYETAPSKALVGYFEIKDIDIGTPSELWEKHSNIGNITRDEYFNYYCNSDVAVGILFEKFIPLTTPVELKKYKILPPQSFKYIPIELFTKITNIEEPHA
jgi:predicted transcriptional regulator